MKFRWSIAPAQPLLAGQLAKQLQITPLLAQCLLNRGLTEPAAIAGFLAPRLKQLADPFLLPDMSSAVERLFQARERKEPIAIFGDYDVDGVTSVTLLLEVLQRLGWQVDFYLPHRMDEGYGLTLDAVEHCLKKVPAQLLVAVDCGSTAVDCIGYLRERQIDTIVLDHHQLSATRPPAVALVNPQVTNCFTELCSAGLAFKLAHALVKRGRETGLPGAAEFDLRTLLDLVALGTIADLVPLRGENRILVSSGLARLDRTARPGLVALKEVARCGSPLGVFEVGFQLAPRLNAAGRLETAEAAINLLRAPDLVSARSLAQELDARNRQRQTLEKTIAEQVLTSIQTKFKPEEDFVIVEGNASWHIGVVGIVASRMVQQFYRPTIIVGGDSNGWRGSGRSIEGFDLAAGLRECSDLLLRHGGHAMAAGVSIDSANISAFRSRFNEVARRTLKPEQLQAVLRLDAEVGLEEVTLGSLFKLNELKPQGQGNPGVQLFTRDLTHQRPLQRLGEDKQHVKMWVTDGMTTREAVWWGAGSESLPVGRFELAFMPQVNLYNGMQTVQLKVLDWRKPE